MVKVARTETAIVGPIMAAVLSGLPGMVVGVGVTITDPGARVDSCTPGVNANPSPKSCGGGSDNRGRKKYYKERAFGFITSHVG